MMFRKHRSCCQFRWKDEEKYCLNLAVKFRNAGISTEIYPDQGKLKKQMKYADQKQIPYVVLVG